jgi:uncharacterized protein involved in cysteine biosynthesis
VARQFGALAGEATSKIGSYIGWTLVAGLIVFAGALLCLLPGLVAAFFLMFVPFLAIELTSGTNPLVGSFNAVKEQAGNLILLFLVFIGLGIALAIVGLILGLIPVIGQILSSVLQFALFGFALCTLAVVYRASAVGRRTAM